MPRRGMIFPPVSNIISLAMLFGMHLRTRGINFCLEVIPGNSYKCMELNLTGIPPHIPNTTQTLDLSFNLLKVLYSNYFSTVLALRFLDLTRCHIWKIENYAFLHLDDLLVLILTGNPLQILGPKAFHHLPSLKKLIAVEVNLSSLESLPIGHLTSLQELNLSHNQIDSLKLPIYFSSLFLLQHLNFQLNKIATISEGDLNTLASLNLTLVLSRNDIKYIERNAFSGVHLQQLFLRDCFENSIVMETGIQNLSGLHTNSLVLGEYRNMHRLKSFSRSLLDGLCHLHLQEIVLIEIDVLQSIDDLSSCINNISTVRMVHSSISEGSDFPQDTNIYHLEFKNSRWKQVPAENLSSLKKLKVLRITHSKRLRYFDDYFTDLPDLEVLDISVNSLVTHLHWFGLMDGAPNLKYLNLSFNSEINLKAECSGPAKLEYLDLQHTKLLLPGTIPSFLCLNNLIYLDITKTGTEILSQCSFCGLDNLRVLKMSENRFGENQLVDNFRNLTKLRFLDVSNCKLKHISFSSLAALHELRILNVSHNNLLDFLPDSFAYLHVFKTLDFHSNQLTALLEKDLKNLPRSLMTMDLSDNLFDCSCDHFSFLTWAKNAGTLLQNTQRMVCHSPIHLKNIQVMDFDLSSCGISITTVVVSVSIILLLFLITILGYKYYFYLYYMMVLFIGDKLSNEKESVYDAFVIFSSKDQEWVKRELQEPLEEKLPYFRLCIFSRDFIPGVSIITNIIKEGFQTSRKVIAVVSSHFLESRWCNFELEVAQSWQLVESKASLILVILEEVDKTILQRKLGLFRYLRRNTYLVWKDRDINRHVFLRQLRSALLDGKMWTEEELKLTLKK